MSKQFWSAVSSFYRLLNIAGDCELSPFELRATFDIACRAVMAAGSMRTSYFDDPTQVAPVADAQCARLFAEMDQAKQGYITYEQFVQAYMKLLSQHIEEEVLYIDIRRSVSALENWYEKREVDKLAAVQGLMELAYTRWVGESCLPKQGEAAEDAATESKKDVDEDKAPYTIQGPHIKYLPDFSVEPHIQSPAIPTRSVASTGKAAAPVTEDEPHPSYALETINRAFATGELQGGAHHQAQTVSSAAVTQPGDSREDRARVLEVAKRFGACPEIPVTKFARALARLVMVLKNSQYSPKSHLYRDISATSLFFPHLSQGIDSSDSSSSPKEASLNQFVLELRKHQEVSTLSITPTRLALVFSRLLDLCVSPLAIAEAVLGGNEIFEGEEPVDGEEEEDVEHNDDTMSALIDKARSSFPILPVGFIEHQYQSAVEFQAELENLKTLGKSTGFAPRNTAAGYGHSADSELYDYSPSTLSRRPFISGDSHSSGSSRWQRPPIPVPSGSRASQQPLPSTSSTGASAAAYQRSSRAALLDHARRMQNQLSQFSFNEAEEEEDGEDDN